MLEVSGDTQVAYNKNEDAFLGTIAVRQRIIAVHKSRPTGTLFLHE
jgi:hypothetical protein